MGFGAISTIILGVGIGGIFYSTAEQKVYALATGVNITYQNQSNTIKLNGVAGISGKSESPIVYKVLPEDANQKVNFSIEWQKQEDKLHYKDDLYVDHNNYLTWTTSFSEGEHPFELQVSTLDGHAFSSIFGDLIIRSPYAESIRITYGDNPSSVNPMQLTTNITESGSDSNPLMALVKYEGSDDELDVSESVQWNITFNDVTSQTYSNYVHVSARAKAYISWDEITTDPRQPINFTVTATTREKNKDGNYLTASQKFALNVIAPTALEVNGPTSIEAISDQAGTCSEPLSATLKYSDGSSVDVTRDVNWSIEVPEQYKNDISIEQTTRKIKWNDQISPGTITVRAIATITVGDIKFTRYTDNISMRFTSPWPTSIDTYYNGNVIDQSISDLFKFEAGKPGEITGFGAKLGHSAESAEFANVLWSVEVQGHQDLNNKFKFDTTITDNISLKWDNTLTQPEDPYTLTITAKEDRAESTLSKSFTLQIMFLNPVESIKLRYVDENGIDVENLYWHYWNEGQYVEGTIPIGKIIVESDPAEVWGGYTFTTIGSQSFYVQDDGFIHYGYGVWNETLYFSIEVKLAQYPDSMQKTYTLGTFEIDTHC